LARKVQKRTKAQEKREQAGKVKRRQSRRSPKRLISR